MAIKKQTTVYGEFAEDFCSNRLEDLCESNGGIQTGPFGSQLHQEDYVNVGTPIITVEHLDENRILHKDIPLVSDKDKKRLSKYTLKKGDIVFSRVGSVDRRALVHSDEEGWLFSGRCLRIRPDKSRIDPEYLSYFFGLPSFKEYIRSIAVGATMPSLNTQILSDVIIYYPQDKVAQQAIAHILGTLDNKIELNRCFNCTLESIIQTIFKSWFVDFDPVHAKVDGRDTGLPKEIDDLFPYSFGDSNSGGIPEGWIIATFGDVAKNPKRVIQPNDIAKTIPYIALEHMPKRCIALSKWDTAVDLASTKFIFKQNEILFGKLRPYFHKVGVAPVDGVCSTDILVISPINPNWFGFILCHASSDLFVEHANARANGTKMPRTSWQELARYPLVLPPENIAQAFNNRIQPMVNRIILSTHESHILSELRDTLLPKLISGELQVSDAKQFIKEASN